MALTLFEDELLATVLDKFKVQFPMLSAWSTDFSSGGAVIGQTKTARIRKAATVRDYDGTTGYLANAAESTALLEDVPVTINRHKHVPVKIDYLDVSSSTINLNDAASEIAFDLGKECVDYVLSLVVAANFSETSTFSTANSDLDATEDIRGDMNTIGARQTGRVGIVNTAVAATLGVDARVASRDYYGQLNGGAAFRGFIGVSGFENIWEYPSLPGNAENLTGFFCTKEAIIIAADIPRAIANPDPSLSRVVDIETMADPDTGLTLAMLTWAETGLMDCYKTVTWIYGAKAGKQGGSAGTITDYAGHRLVSA